MKILGICTFYKPIEDIKDRCDLCRLKSLAQTMTQVSTTKTIYQDREALRKQESTLFHVTRGWLPAQTNTLENIKENLRSEEYSGNSQQLVLDLKQDLALYTTVISKLKPQEDSANGTIDPIGDLKKLSSEEILDLLPKNAYHLSKHRIEKGTSSQKACLAFSLLSSTASETFAVQAKGTGYALSVDDVTSSSLMRQLGFNLFAWNYSTLFFKLVRIYKNNSDELDRALYRNFGFTPLTIAEVYAKKWNLSVELRSSLSANASFQAGDRLREICELGDSFGKTTQPSLFPTAKKEWDEKTDRLKELIGTDNTLEIREQIESSIEERLKNLLRTEPTKYNSSFSMLRPTEAPISVHIASPFFNQLPDKFKQTYEPVYLQLLEKAAKLPILKELTENVIPSSGFLSGAIYLQSDDSDDLKVKIEVGKTQQNRASSLSLNQTAIEAIGSSVPHLNKEQSVTRISSSFSSANHNGVLVLELDKNLENSADRDNILLFKAARECIANCLD